MGVFDQAGRFATRDAPNVAVQRLLRGTPRTALVQRWIDTRSLPLPGGPERTADLVAELRLEDGTLALLIWEVQAQVDVAKLGVTLEEAAILHNRLRDDHGQPYCVLTALVYLRDRCPATELALTLGDFGTRHRPLLWEVASDDALAAVAAVETSSEEWGGLYWVPLMAGGDTPELIARWREVLLSTVADRVRRGNVIAIALVFAELARCRDVWNRGLEGLDMTESIVVNEWIAAAEEKALLRSSRQKLIEVIEARFPDALTSDIRQFLAEQDTLSLLNDWFRAALRVPTYNDFLSVLRR
jgi:hypothetical protein